MAAIQRATSALFAFIPARIRPQTTDLTSGVLWGTTFAVGAMWLIQPFDWIKQQFSKREEEERS